MERKVEETAPRSKHRFQPEVAKPPFFDKDPENMIGFVTACKLYIIMKMRS